MSSLLSKFPEVLPKTPYLATNNPHIKLDKCNRKEYTLVKMDKKTTWENKKDTLTRLYWVEGKTLAEIGSLLGVTRERVRQLMEKHGIPRNSSRCGHKSPEKKYPDLESYFKNHENRKRDSTYPLRQLLKPTQCAECGRTQSLDIHHIKYPASSLDDVEVLCRSCHQLKHKQGMTYEKQILLYDLYIKGAHYRELMDHFGISQPLVYLIINKIKKGYHTLRK